jgi:hypothetical protein
VIFGGENLTYLNDLWELPLSTLAWHAIKPAGPLPNPRSGAACALDVIRDRVVIFGGMERDNSFNIYPGSDTWVYRLDGSSGWAELHPINAPGPLDRAAAIFDSDRNSMIVFGGINEYTPEAPTISGAVMQLSFGSESDPDSTANWSYFTGFVGPDKGDRYGHTAIRRTAQRQLVIFGGASEYGAGVRNDVLLYSLDGTQTWTMGPSFGPPHERKFEPIIYDPRRGRVVLSGGWDGEYFCDPILCLVTYYGDTWNLELHGNPHWNERMRIQDSPYENWRGAHSAIYDPVRDRMVVFGGMESRITLMNDVWTLGLDDAGTWSQVATQGASPAPRRDHSAIYDPLRDRMLVFGGGVAPNTVDHGAVPTNELWQLTLTGNPTWSQLSPAGTIPSPRAGHAAIYDPIRDRMIVIGGPDTLVWGLTLSPVLQWDSIVTTGGAPAFGGEIAAIYDPLSDRVVVFSGTSAINVWSLDLGTFPAAWSKVTPSGALPPPSPDYSAAYDPEGDRVVLFGLDAMASAWGQGGYPVGNRTWALHWGRAVPALASVVSAEAQANRARVVWFLPGGAGSRGSVQRRTADSDWTTVGEVTADASGLAPFEDRSVLSGARYGYRLETEGVYSAEVWIDVPLTHMELRVDGAQPNPAASVSLAFSLRSLSEARIELFDLRGRRVLTKRIAGFEPGAHVLRLPEADALGTGLYLVRLTQDGQTVSNRLTLLR